MANKLLNIVSRDYYDKKGSIPSHKLLLKLTNDEYEKLISYSNNKYEEYNKEFRNHTINRNRFILYGFMNEALS